MKINKKIFICALLVLMLLCCVNAASAEESLNETLESDVADDLAINEIPDETLSASGDTLIVDTNGGGDYDSISAAVSAATGGETILIKNGEYTETSKIDIGAKQLTFTGESQDGVIIKSGDNDLFYTTTSGYTSLVFNSLTFKDISMTGSRTPLYIGGDGDVTITDCTFDNCASRYGAIRLYTAGNVLIDNCKLLNTQSSTGSYSSAIDFGGSSSSEYTLKNTFIDGSTQSSASTASYIFGVIYNEKTDGSVNLDNVTISNCNVPASGIITAKGNMNIKNSRFVNNSVQRDNQYSALFFISSGSKTVNIESSVIANNSEPNYIVAANTGTSSFDLNYNNIQDNTYKLGVAHPTSGTYALDANYWGSNELPDGVTASTWVVENNGQFELNNGDSLEKEVPSLVEQGTTYDVYVSEDGSGDGSSMEEATDLATAFAIVPEGGSIFVANGIYSLDDGIMIGKSFNLIGESRDGVEITIQQGIAIANPENPFDNEFSIDSISFSSLTFAQGSAQFSILVSSNVNELTVNDCAIDTTNPFIVLGRNLMGEAAQVGGNFNFNNNVLSYAGYGPIDIAGNWNANINNNLFLNDESGENVIAAEYNEGTVNVDYNYWGSNAPATTLEPENWIVVNANADASEIYTDESAKVTIETTLNDGSSASSYLPKYEIVADLTAYGTLSENEVILNNGLARVTYNSDVARSDNIRIKVLGQTITIPITVKERYLGIIYVNMTGDDENSGSIDAPVATVGKAVELALVNGGSGQIIIDEGTYAGHDYEITKDLNITGMGNVIIDAESQGGLFYVPSGNGVNQFILNNVNLVGAQANYGQAVRSYASELILNNVNITNNPGDGSLITQWGKTTIQDCVIANHNGGNVLEISGSADVLINNTIIENNVVTSYAIVYAQSATGNAIVENTVFRNNTGQLGIFKVGKKTAVNNSKFIDNTNAGGYGGAISDFDSLTVTNSTFINNKAAGDSGAIQVGYNREATITQSTFINNSANTLGDSRLHGDAINNNGKLTINDCIILTNAENYVIYNGEYASLSNAQNNWWGTNDDPSSLVSTASDCEVDVSNWVTMDASFAPEDAQAGDEVTVTATFSNANLPDGINVTFTSTSGNLNTVVAAVSGQASTTYTIDENDEAINATSTNAVVEMPIVTPFTTNIVTNDTFYNFFDESGILKDEVPFEELIFQGEFSDLAAGYVIITKSVTITGENAVLNNMGFVIASEKVALDNLTLVATTSLGDLISVTESYVGLTNLTISYTVDDGSANVINVKGTDTLSDIYILDNSINFESHATTDNALVTVINLDDVEDVIVDANNITADMPSLTVSTYDFTYFMMGLTYVNPIRVYEASAVELTNNNIDVTVNSYESSFPTVQSLYIAGSDDVLVKGNNFTMIDNLTPAGTAIYLYAVECGFSEGIEFIENNFNISTTGGQSGSGSAYALQVATSEATFIGNNITCDSNGPNLGIYSPYGFGQAKDLVIKENFINVTGYAAGNNDYALISGIEVQIGYATIYNNTIYSQNKGEYNDTYPVAGISAVQYSASTLSFDIKDNEIYTNGKYTVNMQYPPKGANVTGNTLYANELTGDDSVFIKSGDNNLVQDNLPGYEGIIYVNATGDDNNKGSIDAPVATVAKAVELAQGKSGQIIIDEGAYEFDATVEVTDDLDISTVGDVVLVGPGSTAAKAFYIKSGDVSISNLTFINFNATNTGSVIRMAAGSSLTLNGTKFIKNGGENRQALIQANGADLTIVNSVFEQNTAHKTSTSYGNIYMTNDGAAISTLYVDNSTFKDNYNKYGVFYLSGAIATIYNSEFIGNNATSSSGGQGAALYIGGTSTYISSYSGTQINGTGAYVLIDNCSFINNTAKGNIGTYASYGGKGGALYVNNNATVFVKDSYFENNVAETLSDSYKGQGGAIYASAGNIQITSSIFKDDVAAEGPEVYMKYYNSSMLHPEELNILNITDSIILNSADAIIVSDTTNGAYAANDNWWGTNDEPASKVSEGITVDSWAKMDASFTSEFAQPGEEVTVTATFDNPNLPDGINVTFTSTSGNLNTVVAAKDGKATATYTIDANDKEIVATSTDAEIVMPIFTNIVTNDTFFKYFDEDGILLEDIPFDELIFQGNFSNLVDTIIIDVPITLTSDEAVLNDIALSIIEDEVTVNGFTFNADGVDFSANGGAVIYVSGSDVEIDNVKVNYVAPSEAEAVAIFANAADNFALTNSEIAFTSVNPGNKHNYGLKVRNSDEAIIDNNTINAVLPAVPVNWAGSGIETDLVLAVGIQGGEDIEFTNNRVNVQTNGSSGSYPTVDAVMIHSVNNILVKSNNITHTDNTTEDSPRYYYSLDLYNLNATVEENNIIVNTTSGVDRAGTAYPIQVTGPATVTIKNNNLTSISKGATAAIYASNWAGAATLIVEDNTIDVTGYATNGNYALLAGIEAEIDMLKAYNNTITVTNLADYDDANQAYGISMTSAYMSGDAVADIKDNNISVNGKYAVYYVKATNTNVTGNTLYAQELLGDEAAVIDSGDNNVIENNLPYKLTIVVSVEGATYPDNVTVKVISNVDGDYTVDINGTEYTVTANGDGISINLGVGSYYANVTVDYASDDFIFTTENATFTVEPGVNNIVVVVEDTVLPGDIVVKVTADVPDTYTVTIGDATVDVVVDETGEGTNTISLLKGKYTATTSWENENYTVTITDAKFTVSRAAGFINITADDIEYGEDLVVEVTLPDDVARRAIVTVDNETKYVSLVNGTGSVKFSGLAAGAHTVVASYNGDANYAVLSANATANVKRATTEIDVFTKVHNYGYDVVVDVVLPSDVSRRAIVTIGNESKYVSLVNGTGSVKFSGLAAGTYEVVASYNGDANYKKCSANTTIVVAKGSSDIKVTANPVAYGEDVVVEVTLPADVSRRAMVTLGNETKYVTLVDGVGSVKFSGLAIGSYDVVASYNGDSNYLKSSATVVAKVTKATPEIQVSASDISVGEALVVDVQLPSDVTKRATVTIGNESKFVSLKEGAGSVKFTGLEAGTHDVVVSYVGDTTYKASSTTTTIEVKE